MSIKGLLYLTFRYAMRLGWKWWLRAFVVAAGVTCAYVLVTSRNRGDLARQGKAGIGAVCSVYLLAFYVVLVLAFTVFGRAPRALEHSLNLDLFGTLAHRLRPESSNGYEILLNLVLFLPFGALLPVVTYWHCMPTMLAACVFSGAIEALQFGLSRGTCELSDLFANVAGASVGYLLYVAVRVLAGVLRGDEPERQPSL